MNFEPDESITNLEDAIEFVNQFNISFALTLDIQEYEFKKIIESLNNFKRLVCTDVLVSEINDEGLYLDYLKEAYKRKVIDKFEYDNLITLVQASYDNCMGRVSKENLEILVNNIQSNWEAKRSTFGAEYGNLLGITLAISQASLEWWTENWVEKLPPQVGTDIAGAVIGGCIALGGQLIFGDGSVNWGAVGYGALGGAITGSTGAVGKLGRWIGKFL